MFKLLHQNDEILTNDVNSYNAQNKINGSIYCATRCRNIHLFHVLVFT